MNGDPQHEQETPPAPKAPEKEKEDKPADGSKSSAKEGSCGTGCGS